MARSAAIPLAIGGFASILLISGIQGETIGEVIKGEFSKETKAGKTPPSGGIDEFAAYQEGVLGSNIPQQSTSESVSFHAGSGIVSPFPKSSGPIAWGRSDQGVDGIVKPGSPLLAMGNGIVEVAGPDPGGFGNQYPVLKIDNDGAYYYGHSIPAVPNGTRVKAGETIGFANTHGQGNATTPGSFEIGKWPPGSFSSAGNEIRQWFIGLPRL